MGDAESESAPSPTADAALQHVRDRLAGIGDPLSVLAGLFAYAPLAYQVYSSDGRSILTNPAFLRLFGSEPPPQYNVLQDELAEQAGSLELIRRAFAGETVHLPVQWYDPRELRQVTVEQGNRVAIEATFFPLFDSAGRISHVVLAFRDLTAEWTARMEAETQRDRLALAQEASRIGTFDWDVETGVVTWTPELEALYGLPPGGFGGRYEDWRVLVHPEDATRAEAEVQAAARPGGELDTQFRVVGKAGTVRHIFAKARTLRGLDGRTRMLGVNMDVTDRVEALAAARDAIRARDEFLSIAAHELRTPVAGIKGTVQLLHRRARGGRLEPEQLTRAIDNLDLASDRLTTLVDDLLDVARLRTGQLLLRREPASLADLVQRAIEQLRAAHPDLRHELVIQVEDDVPPVRVDPVRIGQVLGNVLDNAVKYSPAGSTVQVLVQRAEGGAACAIADAGMGLPPGAEETIFEPFGRAANAAAGHLPGLGLGLYVSRDLVERHRGRIWAESAGEGSGTTVRLWLPAAE